LGYQTLMNRAGEQGDAVPINLIAKVLTGDANTGGAGWRSKATNGLSSSTSRPSGIWYPKRSHCNDGQWRDSRESWRELLRYRTGHRIKYINIC